MRALLSNYLSEGCEPVSINKLVRKSITGRHDFDEMLGLSSAMMTDEEILQHRPRLQELLAKEIDSAAFVKTHEPFAFLPDGTPLFSPYVFSRAVYIVRNPLDIAVSYAHHLQYEIDQTIKVMNNYKAMLSDQRVRIFAELPQWVSDWSHNVSSWLNQVILPVKVVKYEDLHTNTDTVLKEVVDFCGFPQDSTQRARAVEHSCFGLLQEQEIHAGFNEKQPTAPNFFRKGQVGNWKSELSFRQVQCIMEQHYPVMDRLTYKCED